MSAMHWALLPALIGGFIAGTSIVTSVVPRLATLRGEVLAFLVSLIVWTTVSTLWLQYMAPRSGIADAATFVAGLWVFGVVIGLALRIGVRLFQRKPMTS